MQIRVLFFGILKDLTGREAESLTLSEHATLADVVRHYEERNPRLQALVPSIAISVNQEYATLETKLESGDEIALLPPVSGGSGEPAVTNRPSASIVREPIRVLELLDNIKQPEDGAAVLFQGIVRNNTRGRRTLFLDYEAYEPMALQQMNDLADQAGKKFPIRQVVIVHRIGRLEIGETSVAIVVASAHRGAAFDACRWIIDTLKRTVPIWKKEHFEDGAVWADGEPFPADIATGEGSQSGRSASK